MVSPGRAVTPRTKWLLFAAGLILAQPAFPQAAVQLEIVADRTQAPPGGRVVVQAIIRNTSSAVLTGLFLNKLSIDDGCFESVTSSDPTVTITKTTSTSGEAYQAMANPARMEPDYTIVLTSRLRMPRDAAQGSTVRFASTFAGFGGQVASGLLRIAIAGAPVGAPQLKILSMGLTQSGDDTQHELRVTNAGDANTDAPIRIDIVPESTTMITAHRSSRFWTQAGSGLFTYDALPLAPGMWFDLDLELTTKAVRGPRGVIARVSGGGSPPDQISINLGTPLRLFDWVPPAYEDLADIVGRVRE